MEDSITKYLTLCQAPEFAVRATLFDGLCLKQQGMFNEAATSYIRYKDIDSVPTVIL